MMKSTTKTARARVERSNRRNRAKPFCVYVSDTERAEIESRAKLVNRSCSDYLRSAALECELHSQFDRRAHFSIIQLHAVFCQMEITLERLSAEHPETAGHLLRDIIAEILEAKRTLAEIVGKYL
jgi:hypothetical protein